LKFPGGGASGGTKFLKKCMKLNWNFQRGRVGEVWILSGTTHFPLHSHCCLFGDTKEDGRREKEMIQIFLTK